MWPVINSPKHLCMHWNIVCALRLFATSFTGNALISVCRRKKSCKNAAYGHNYYMSMILKTPVIHIIPVNGQH